MDDCSFRFFFNEVEYVKLVFLGILNCVEYGGKMKKGFFCKIVRSNFFRRWFDLNLNKMIVKKIDMDGFLVFYEG